jgi:ABC-type Fe3+/spermidine/putrescine transport system ATPase subunit
MEQAVELAGVRKAFGDFVAVKSVDLTIAEGSFVTLLGPSGCGKTTILRMVAGLETPTGGEIRIKGKRVNETPIHKRNLGLVFQNYALFPHKTIFDNVAFGLKYRNVDRERIRERVTRALDIVRLPGVEKRLPSQLSGGQQQRIALARAIVIEPDVLLLDEPLSALDANLREEMRTELKQIQRELGVTTIFVTHDQEEALAMSDQVVVMDHGSVEQVGAPEDVYRWPATRFVARFLGQSNIIPGRTERGLDGATAVRLENGRTLRVATKMTAASTPVEVVVRAHRVLVGPPGKAVNGAGNRLQGVVTGLAFQGGTACYFIDAGGVKLQAINAIEERMFRESEPVEVAIAPGDCVLLDQSGKRIG